MVWKRPQNVEYPKKWLHFKSEKNNQAFVIKDLTPEYYDITLGYMTNMFLNESAIAKPLKILEDPISRAGIQKRWLEILKGNMALVCVTADQIPRVAGVHLTMIRDKNSKHERANTPSPTDPYAKFTQVVDQLKHEGNLFDRFGGDFYLGSLGLFVLPEFRGLGIATQFLKARIQMCLSLGLPGTATVFSTPGAQAAATKAGYHLIATKSPDDCNGFRLDHTIAIMGFRV